MNKFLLLVSLLFTPLLVRSQTPTASFSNWKDNKKAAYTIVHDDFSNYVTGIFKYADTIAYNRQIKLCFGAITTFCGATEWAQARTMIGHGHECINHTHNHYCGGNANDCAGQTSYGPSQFATELALSTQLIEANTSVRPLFFIHPYDAPSAAVESYLTGLGYLGARGGTQAVINTSTFNDYMHLNYHVWGPSSAISSLNKAVDDAITAGGFAMREFHGIADGSYGAMTPTNYRNHLDYVKTQIDNGNIWSATASEVITYKMQRDAYQPTVNYNAFNGQINVNFTNILNISASISKLKTPVTVNVNLNGISNPYIVSQRGISVPFTRVGNIISFNVYPHQGPVILNCTNCLTIANVTGLTATPQPSSALVNWTNTTEPFNDVLVVVKEGSGFSTKPLTDFFVTSADFLGNGAVFETTGKAVYQGNGTLVRVSNLKGGKTYYVRVYVRRGNDWSSGVETTVTIPEANIPNVTNLAVTPQSNAALASWTNPVLFNDVLVVVKQGTGFTTQPNAISYSFDANFTGVGAAFEGGKVVYQGQGTSVNITNLTAGQTYFVRVYVRNGVNWSVGVQTSVTLPLPPTPDVTNFAVIPQIRGAMATWTNPTTPFSNVLIVAKEGSGFTTIPTLPEYIYDPSFIGGGSVFEGGKVVYQGIETAATIIDLMPEKTYFFRIYVRNGNSWSAGVERSVTILAPAIPNVTNLVALPKVNGASATWTNPAASAFDNVLVVVKESSGFTTKPTATDYIFDPNFTGSGAVFEGGKVVYQGTGSVVNISNLTPEKTYFIRVYVRSGAVWSAGVETSVIVPPIPNVTNLIALGKLRTASVSWINPAITEFNNVLVVAKEGSGFTTKPTAIDYIFDPSFIGGGVSFEGGKVVYQGTANAVDITDLTPEKTYFIRVYVRNGTNWTVGVETSVTIPLVSNVTNLVATAQINSAVVNWTNPTTIFSNVLVVIKEGSGFTTKPTAIDYIFDANFVGGGAVFEGGKVVYQGTGRTVNITNLTPDKTYFIRVYVRDGTSWTAGVETSVTISGVSNVTNLVASPQVRGAAVTWTNPTTLFSSILVVAKEGSGFTTKPTVSDYLFDANFIGIGASFEGGKVVYQGTGRSVNITNLTPDKTYFIRVYVRDGATWSLGVETSATIESVGTANCLKASYFNNMDLSGKADLIRYETSINYKWDTLSPARVIKRDSFSVRWEGSFTAPITGRYEFSTKTNEGVRLWVNGILLINRWTVQPARTIDTFIDLNAGNYTIKMEYFDRKGNATARLKWDYPGFRKAVMSFNNCGTPVVNSDVFTILNSDNAEMEDEEDIEESDIDNDIQVLPITTPVSSYLFNIFPNPAKERIAVDLSECAGQSVYIEVISFLGRELYKEKVNAASTTPHIIDTRTLTAGQYVIRITPEGKNAVIKKMVIVH